jgi:hypothetical protein
MKNCRLFYFCLISFIFIASWVSAEITPFTEDLEVHLLNSQVNVHDVDTAEAAGMVINEGFPVDGVVSVGNSTLRLRSWPWGDVMANYTSGTNVRVIGETGEFFLVEIDGRQGYMHRNYVTVPGAPANGERPDYPGNTASGGALSLQEGVKASNSGANGKTTVIGKTPSNTTGSDKSPATDTSEPAPETSGNSNAEKVSTGSNGKIYINVPKKCQMQVKCPAPGSACGPTSLAMILSFYTGKNVDSLATDLWNVCGSTKSSGTGHAGLAKGAKKYGYPNAKWHYCVAQSWIRNQLKAGKPILAHVKGHYVVIKGIDNSGRIYFNDPGRSKVDRSMSFSEFSAWWRGAGSKHPCMVLE